jgi:hypothetical protein
MGENRGLILWTLCGAGVFLLYAAYKNQQPQTLLLNHLNGSTDSAPISTSTVVPTVTDSTGKTWNTAPGDGGFITSDPPTPDAPYGSKPNVQVQGFTHVVPDLNGRFNVVDSNGLILATVPDAYQGSAATYIPTVRV